jgi:metallo-beta-lactamase family protein
MKVTFYGAAQNVTGSKHLIQTGSGEHILLDCGLHQGQRQEANRLNRSFPITAVDIEAVVLSHAHLDHCGMLPVLVKQGFKGKIFCTNATADIAKYILLDSANIQEQDAIYINRHLRPGEPEVDPLYTQREAEMVFDHFARHPYKSISGKPMAISRDVHLDFYDAGHILGSSICYLTIKEDGKQKTLAYSGDLGQGGAPILKEPEVIDLPVENLILEATYGSRVHAPLENAEAKLIEIIQKAVDRKSKILLPAFSLGRTQEIVYILHKLTDEGKIPRIPIYVDSPLSNKITQVFEQHAEDYNLEVYKDFSKPGEDPLAFRNLHYISTVEESMALNDAPGPCMIIAASGMMENGRIRHHLAHGIENPDNIIVITGYQAAHTLGRKIHHGESPVRIFDKYFEVKAEVETINEFSAHADRNGLLNYVSKLNGLKRVFLVHAEPVESESFKELLLEHYPALEVHIPAPGDSFEI